MAKKPRVAQALITPDPVAIQSLLQSKGYRAEISKDSSGDPMITSGVAGAKMVAALRQRGVLLAMMDGRIRACTHLDVSAGMIEETIGLVREIVRAA